MNGGTPTSLSSIDRGFATHQGVCIIGQVPHVPSGRALRDLPGTLGQTLGACIIHDHRSGAVRIVRREDPARDAGEARTRRRESEGEDWKRHVVVSPGCGKSRVKAWPVHGVRARGRYRGRRQRRSGCVEVSIVRAMVARAVVRSTSESSSNHTHEVGYTVIP